MKAYYRIYKFDSNNENYVEECCARSIWRCYFQFLKWAWPYYRIHKLDSNNENYVEECCTRSIWRCYFQFLKWAWHHKVEFSDIVQQNTYYGAIIEYIIPDNNKFYIIVDFL